MVPWHEDVEDLMKGKTNNELDARKPCIDVRFEGRYTTIPCGRKWVITFMVTQYPTDTELHRIIARLSKASRRVTFDSMVSVRGKHDKREPLHSSMASTAPTRKDGRGRVLTRFEQKMLSDKRPDLYHIKPTNPRSDPCTAVLDFSDLWEYLVDNPSRQLVLAEFRFSGSVDALDKLLRGRTNQSLDHTKPFVERLVLCGTRTELTTHGLCFFVQKVNADEDDGCFKLVGTLLS